MERAKEILALAPFIAIAIAISYLQGYWGAFEILAFPYLSFQELLAYSTAPLFGFVFFSLVGALLGVISSIAQRGQAKNKWVVRFENAGFLSICALLIYLDLPEKWLVAPIVAFVLIVPDVLRISAFESARQTNPHLVLSALLIVFLLLESFGYGRTQAERLIQKAEPNVQLTLESGTETGKLIGKLGSYYFFLNASSKVNVLPEQSIKRIEYRKELKRG